MVGIYSQTYKQKKVTKQVPDAVVYINNDPLIRLCPSCEGQIDVNDYITQISTSLSNNTTVGTANFNIAIPKHGHKGAYMVRGGRVFGISLMDEIDIYMKARFPSVGGEYQYHKVFWGVITSIDESYGNGNQNISVGCESMLKWLQLMKTNEHPAINALSTIKGDDQTASLSTGKTYSNMNVYEIIQSMVDITFRNMVIPEGLDTERININGETINIGAINPASKQLLTYWKKRFSEIKSSLRMFGISKVEFDEEKNKSKDSTSNNTSSSRVKNREFQLRVSKNPLSPFKINYDSKALMDFKPFIKFNNAKSFDLISSTYRNNLEIINEIKTYTGYEFYLDTTGELIFKPPFWNLDTSENKVYSLEDMDIISYSFNESESEVVTRLEVVGSPIAETAVNGAVAPRGVYTNYDLARQFGLRSEQMSISFFRDANLCYYHAISEMDRINANRYRGNITIVGRPELRLGIPVYLVDRDIYGYIDNISHNFTYGGQFTTQIQISAIRRKYTGEDGISADLDYNTNGRSFGLTGKSAILIFEQSEELNKEFKKGQNLKGNVALGIKSNTESQNRSKNVETDSTIPYKSNRAGVYNEVSLESDRAAALLRNLDQAKNSDDQDSYLKFLEIAIPVSDEKGYELIGTYENGRSLLLDNSQILRKKANSFSEILSRVLQKNTKNNTFKASGITVFNSYEKPYESQNTKQELEDSSIRSKTNNVNTFLQSETKSIRDINPKESSDFKSCNCFDPALTSSKVDNRNNKKTISNTKRGR
jgi:hypothetical protein